MAPSEVYLYAGKADLQWKKQNEKACRGGEITGKGGGGKLDNEKLKTIRYNNRESGGRVNGGA